MQRRRIAVIGLACLGVGASSQAAVRTWVPASTDQYWNTPANWSGTVPTTGDAVTFPSGTYSYTTLTNDISGLQLSAVTGQTTALNFGNGAPSLTLAGNAIQIGAGTGAAYVIYQNSANLQTVNFDISFPSVSGNAQRIIEASAGKLRINGTLTNTTGTQAIQLQGNQTIDVYGTINNANNSLSLGQSYSGNTPINIYGNLTGTGGLTSGRGVTTIAASTDISGILNVGGGTNSGTYSSKVVLAHADALKSVSTLTLMRDNTTGGMTGGTVSLVASANGINRSQPITIYDSTQSGATTEIGGTTGLGANGAATFSGNVTLGKAGGSNGVSRNIQLTSAEGRVTFSGVLSDQPVAGQTGQMSITKTGAGTVVLSGNNTYRGTTTVNTGTLLVNNTAGSGTSTGALTVNNAAILGGTGAIGGAVTLNNTSSIAPGDGGVESLSVGSLTMGSTTTALFEINGWNAGQFDTITSSGALSLGGTLDVTFANGIGAGSAQLLAFGSYGGSITPVYHNLPAGATPIFDASTGTLSIVIPEPSTIAIVAAAALFAGVRRRRC